MDSNSTDDKRRLEGVAAPLEPTPEKFFNLTARTGPERPDDRWVKLTDAVAYAAAVSKNLQVSLHCCRRNRDHFEEMAANSQARILKLEKEIAALWIPIEKKLPESRMVVLVKKANMSPTIQSAFYCPTHSKGPGFYCGERLTDVTHWRPFTESC